LHWDRKATSFYSFIHSLFIHSGMHEKALNWACIPYISLVLNAKKIKILIVICHDEHDEIKVIIIINLMVAELDRLARSLIVGYGKSLRQ
jgi:hypothetical protein